MKINDKQVFYLNKKSEQKAQSININKPKLNKSNEPELNNK